MNANIFQFVTKLHATASKQLILYTTGAGSKAIMWLMNVAGASKSVLDLHMPYDQEATQMLLQNSFVIDKFVASETVQQLARAAYLKALHVKRAANPTSTLAQVYDTVYGVACSASIVTSQVKKGHHQAYLGIYDAKGYNDYHLIIDKSKQRTREEEDALVSFSVLHAISEYLYQAPFVPLQEALGELDKLQKTIVPLNATLQHFIDTVPVGSNKCVLQLENQQLVSQDNIINSVPWLLLPGSFNPVHKGHWELMQAAKALVPANTICAFELSIQNVDKPSLDEQALKSRLSQFANQLVLVSKAPMFAQKVGLLNAPALYFIIGADTAARLVDTKYYEHSREKMLLALLQFAKQNVTFLVAGRKDESTNTFVTLAQITIPEGFSSLFVAIPDFRVDLSSTELRKKM